MDRRRFIKTSGAIGGLSLMPLSSISNELISNSLIDTPWFDRSMRWAQLAFVENDPGHYDPDFWLDYFKSIHADGALLSAGGIVAFYQTSIPLHHRSDWIGSSDPLSYLIQGCRKMNMTVILRTDPHAARQDVFEAHPDWIAVSEDGQPRHHWARPDLWVTCALGPYNFSFMTSVHQEIMERFQPEGIFSNRWGGHGICYCVHCKKNFKEFSGYDLPPSLRPGLSTAMAPGDKHDEVYRKYREWRIERLKELWFLWDEEIRKRKPTARFIPNGFPDKLITGQHADFFFADQQARSGVIPPWSNAKHAKEIRATMGMKPQVGIFSVGFEEPYRWKDSVQSNAEIRIWVAEGVANGLRPCFVKFGGYIFDKRWMPTVRELYTQYYKHEKYLRNTAPLVRVGIVYSEQTTNNYGGSAWQKDFQDHAYGMYHAMVEAHIPFEMVNDQLLEEDDLAAFKLLILPNIAALSDVQCEQLRKFVQRGGSLVATFETSLYDENGKERANFGLSDLFGVKYSGHVEGPLQNSYLRIKPDTSTGKFHAVAQGLEDAYRIINTTYRVAVEPTTDFPSPVTLVPTYPDLPMEDVYPRTDDSSTRELYLRQVGSGRVAYFNGDLDRAFWQIMSVDHSQLLRNTIRWALEEDPIVSIEGPGLVDASAWKQEKSMTIHLVNLTNPMMMKGPFRELIPLDVRVTIRIPNAWKVARGKLLMSGDNIAAAVNARQFTVPVKVIDHEIIALDLA